MPRDYVLPTSVLPGGRSTGQFIPTSGGTAPAALTPLSPSYWDSAYGGHPATPNPVSTASQSVLGNIGNLAAIYRLATSANAFQNQQLLNGLNQNLPGYSAMSSQSSANIASHLRGQVPNDVVNQILQNAAERGIATGGGPNANAAYLRALGLTSLGLQSQGETELSNAVSRTPRATPLDVSRFFVTPDQMQAAAQHAATVAAAPVPADAARAAQSAALAGLRAGGSAVPGYSSIGPLPGGSSVGTWTPRGELPTLVGRSTGTDTLSGGLPTAPGGGGGGSWNSWWNNTQSGDGGLLPDEEDDLFWQNLAGQAGGPGTVDIPAGGDGSEDAYY